MEVRLYRTMDRFFNARREMMMMMMMMMRMMILFILVLGGVVTLTINMFQSTNTPSGGTQTKSTPTSEYWFKRINDEWEDPC